MSSGGRLTQRLTELCAAGFLQAYFPYNKQQGQYYKLIDEYCLFYLRWVQQSNKRFTNDYWLSRINSASYHAWSGYAFEAICWKHVDQIIAKLHLPAGGTIASWRVSANKQLAKGAQIDLLIDRNDDAITLCEIKYTNKPFVIDKNYALTLQHKIDSFKLSTKTNKQLFLVMIASQGVQMNKYATLLLDAVVEVQDLFKSII